MTSAKIWFPSNVHSDTRIWDYQISFVGMQSNHEVRELPLAPVHWHGSVIFFFLNLEVEARLSALIRV